MRVWITRDFTAVWIQTAIVTWIGIVWTCFSSHSDGCDFHFLLILFAGHAVIILRLFCLPTQAALFWGCFRMFWSFRAHAAMTFVQMPFGKAQTARALASTWRRQPIAFWSLPVHSMSRPPYQKISVLPPGRKHWLILEHMRCPSASPPSTSLVLFIFVAVFKLDVAIDHQNFFSKCSPDACTYR